MIEYSSNIEVVIAAKLAQLAELQNNPDPVLRTVAMAVLPALLIRVHTDGKDSSGNQIGTYSPGYMVVRTGAYKNAGTFAKGAKKGEQKDSGKNVSTGAPRPKYNRTSDTKVILSLTRQMELDTSVIQTPNGYGIGYLNSFNYQKALWCEETYKKPILTELTTDELELAKKTAQDFTIEYLKTI